MLRDGALEGEGSFDPAGAISSRAQTAHRVSLCLRGLAKKGWMLNTCRTLVRLGATVMDRIKWND